MSVSIHYGEKHDFFKVCYKLNNLKLHREDGPAITYKNGGESWYLNGVYYYYKTMPLDLYLAYCKWENKKNEN